MSGAAAKAETGLIAAVGWMFPVSAGRTKVAASQTETGVSKPTASLPAVAVAPRAIKPNSMTNPHDRTKNSVSRSQSAPVTISPGRIRNVITLTAAASAISAAIARARLTSREAA